jgi:lysophospholipase L1-like esterase
MVIARCELSTISLASFLSLAVTALLQWSISMLDWYEADVRALEAERVRQAIPKDPVVFYGSSTVRLWSALAEDLENPRALNLGFCGSTLEACAYFFERLVPPVDPCSLVVYAGDNDLGDGRSPQEVLGFFRALADKVHQELNGVEFAFISVKPSPARFHIMDRIQMANKLIQEEITVRGQGYFIDIFDAMLGPDGKPQPKLFNEDGLHMNQAGYQLWTELLSPYRPRIFTLDCKTS